MKAIIPRKPKPVSSGSTAIRARIDSIANDVANIKSDLISAISGAADKVLMPLNTIESAITKCWPPTNKQAREK